MKFELKAYCQKKIHEYIRDVYTSLYVYIYLKLKKKYWQKFNE